MPLVCHEFILMFLQTLEYNQFSLGLLVANICPRDSTSLLTGLACYLISGRFSPNPSERSLFHLISTFQVPLYDCCVSLRAI